MKHVAVVITLAALLTGAAAPALADEGASQVVATTLNGRVVTATRFGPQNAGTVLVLLGQMHGTEPAGKQVIDSLAKRLSAEGALDLDTSVWLITTMNPDGSVSGKRTNDQGVDLNRNFPQGWIRTGAGTSQWSGPSPASETETRGMMAFLAQVRPTAVLSFHQPFGVVDITHPRSRQAGRKLATWMGLPARAVGCPGPCHGTLTGWVDQTLGAIALTVELPDHVSEALLDRTSSAVLRLSRWLSQ